MRRPLSVVVVLLALWTYCKAENTTTKILLVPVQTNSHMMEVGHAVSELTNRGYELHMVVSEVTKVPSNILSYGINILRYKTRYSTMPYARDDFALQTINSGDDAQWLSDVSVLFLADCKEMMADREFVRQIRNMQFNLAVVDHIFICPCTAILPYNLSLPFITVGSDFLSSYHGVPALPSFVPNIMTTFSDSMTFIERLKNTLSELTKLKPALPGQTDTSLLSEYGHHPHDQGRMIFELPRESALSILNIDPILGYAIPLMPRIKFAGGLSTSEAKSLPQDLETIMSNSHSDVILVSFGSVASLLPEHVNKKLAEVFLRVKHTVIWRYNGNMSYITGNDVHVRKWLPQNDILGHPKTKLFITHSGNNGQFEALYHGVPMVAFYLWGDQKHNAYRIEEKGFGFKVNLIDFKPNELFRKINEVLTNEKYRNTIQRASKIYRDQPMTARETSAFWIQHVLKYGSDHLKSGATDLPWYAYLMLDILLVFVTAGLCVVFIMLSLVNLMLKFCISSGIDTDKKKQ